MHPREDCCGDARVTVKPLVTTAHGSKRIYGGDTVVATANDEVR